METVGELGHAPRPGFNETSDEALSRGVTFASRYITSMYYVLLQEMDEAILQEALVDGCVHPHPAVPAVRPAGGPGRR